jgi:hypothetical protein
MLILFLGSRHVSHTCLGLVATYFYWNRPSEWMQHRENDFSHISEGADIFVIISRDF